MQQVFIAAPVSESRQSSELPVKASGLKLKPVADPYGYAQQPGSERSAATYEEIRAWYAYDWANSPYYQVYVSCLFPVFVKWLAEGYASGQVESDSTAGVATTTEDKVTSDKDPANMKMPGLGITAASYPLALSLVTIFLQTLFLLCFSAYGDYGNKRKKLLGIFTYVGAGLVFLNIFCFSYSMWWLAGVARIFAGICFVFAGVYYNAYLPMLASQHQDLVVPVVLQGEERDDKVEELNDEISNKGMITGYAGGATTLFICYFVLLLTACDKNKDTCSEFELLFPVCACIALVGLWWAAFGSYTLLKLKARPGAEYPPNASKLCLGVQATCAAFSTLRKYRNTLMFLIAFCFYSDAVNTVTAVAVLLLEDENDASITALMLSTILAVVGVFAGVWLFLGVQKCFNASAKGLIITQLIIFAGVCVACLCGIVTAFDGMGFYFALAPAMLVLGSLQAYSRSVFSCLCPVGKEAAFFSFYEITDKGSNLIGSTVALVVRETTSSYIGTFWYLLVAFVVSACLMYFVDVDQGMIDAGKNQDRVRELVSSDEDD